jgi:hypothetical protein
MAKENFMSIRWELVLWGAILAGTAAADQLTVTSSCTNATCIGGIKSGVTLQDGVQALDVYTDAIADPSQSGSVLIDVTALLGTSGSGPGTLVVDPMYTFDVPTAQSVEFDLIWNVGDTFGGCIRILFCVPSPDASATIPITLGTTFNFSLLESMSPPHAFIPPQANIGQDIELWALGPNGATPVFLATDAIPEPTEWTLLSLGFVLIAARLRRISASSHRVD